MKAGRSAQTHPSINNSWDLDLKSYNKTTQVRELLCDVKLGETRNIAHYLESRASGNLLPLATAGIPTSNEYYVRFFILRALEGHKTAVYQITGAYQMHQSRQSKHQ